MRTATPNRFNIYLSLQLSRCSLHVSCSSLTWRKAPAPKGRSLCLRPEKLPGHVVGVELGGRRFLGGRAGGRATVATLRAVHVALGLDGLLLALAPRHHLDVEDDVVRGVAADLVLVEVRARGDAAGALEEVTLARVGVDDLGVAPERHHAVPVGLVLVDGLAVLGADLLGPGGRDGEGGHGLAAARHLGLRVVTQAATEAEAVFVENDGHGGLRYVGCCVDWGLRLTGGASGPLREA